MIARTREEGPNDAHLLSQAGDGKMELHLQSLYVQARHAPWPQVLEVLPGPLPPGSGPGRMPEASTHTPRPALLARDFLTAARRWKGEPCQITSGRALALPGRCLRNSTVCSQAGNAPPDPGRPRRRTGLSETERA
jgi:hypothetical protein